MSLGQLTRRVVIADSLGNLVTTTTVGADQALDVNVVATTGGAGVQYTEGDDLSGGATGTAMIGNDVSSDLAAVPDLGTGNGTGIEMGMYVRPLQGDPSANRTSAILQLEATPAGEDVGPSNPVPVTAASLPLPTGAATEATLDRPIYTEGDVDASIDGIPMLWEDASNTLRAISASKPLPISGAITGSVDINKPAVAITHTAVSVGVASGSILAANSNRRYLLLINDSANVIYIKFGVAAVLNEGLRLNARGGFFEGGVYSGAVDTSQIFAISAVAASNLLVSEGV